MLRAEAPEQVLQELWAWLTTTQLVRTAGAHATAVANTGQVRLGTPARPRDAATHPVTCHQVGFTATRRAVATTIWRTTPTTGQALATQAQATAATILSDLVQTDRHRYKPRRNKWRPSFPHTATPCPPTADPPHSTCSPSPASTTTTRPNQSCPTGTCGREEPKTPAWRTAPTRSDMRARILAEAWQPPTMKRKEPPNHTIRNERG